MSSMPPSMSELSLRASEPPERSQPLPRRVTVSLGVHEPPWSAPGVSTTCGYRRRRESDSWVPTLGAVAFRLKQATLLGARHCR